MATLGSLPPEPVCARLMYRFNSFICRGDRQTAPFIRWTQSTWPEKERTDVGAYPATKGPFWLLAFFKGGVSPRTRKGISLSSKELHPVSQHLGSTYYMPGPRLRARDTKRGKRKILSLRNAQPPRGDKKQTRHTDPRVGWEMPFLVPPRQVPSFMSQAPVPTLSPMVAPARAREGAHHRAHGCHSIPLPRGPGNSSGGSLSASTWCHLLCN